jgi:hypothetical protein
MMERVDIAVVGGGASGVAAAVCAARTGRTTLLFDQRPAAGGTGGFSGLTTLCGSFDDDGAFLNEGFAREFAEAIAESPPRKMGRLWVQPYRPERFRQVAAQLVRSSPNLHACWNSPACELAVENQRIVGLNKFKVGAVIDCTGSAEVARLAGAECLATDETTQSPAIIFPLGNVTRVMTTPADAAQVLLPLVRAGLPPLSFQPHVGSNTVTVKFSGRSDQVPGVIEFLRTRVAGFENCTTPETSFEPVERAGRMIIGRYVLTGEDVLAGRKFPDAVARCSWPIEQWNADGVARFRYLPPGTHYEIPARALRAAGLENLFMAGKTLSADPDAIASARVMGCCLATGAAAGVLAARHVESSASA